VVIGERVGKSDIAREAVRMMHRAILEADHAMQQRADRSQLAHRVADRGLDVLHDDEAEMERDRLAQQEIKQAQERRLREQKQAELAAIASAGDKRISSSRPGSARIHKDGQLTRASSAGAQSTHSGCNGEGADSVGVARVSLPSRVSHYMHRFRDSYSLHDADVLPTDPIPHDVTFKPSALPAANPQDINALKLRTPGHRPLSPTHRQALRQLEIDEKSPFRFAAATLDLDTFTMKGTAMSMDEAATEAAQQSLAARSAAAASGRRVIAMGNGTIDKLERLGGGSMTGGLVMSSNGTLLPPVRTLVGALVRPLPQGSSKRRPVAGSPSYQPSFVDFTDIQQPPIPRGYRLGDASVGGSSAAGTPRPNPLDLVITTQSPRPFQSASLHAIKNFVPPTVDARGHLKPFSVPSSPLPPLSPNPTSSIPLPHATNEGEPSEARLAQLLAGEFSIPTNSNNGNDDVVGVSPTSPVSPTDSVTLNANNSSSGLTNDASTTTAVSHPRVLTWGAAPPTMISPTGLSPNPDSSPAASTTPNPNDDTQPTSDTMSSSTPLPPRPYTALSDAPALPEPATIDGGGVAALSRPTTSGGLDDDDIEDPEEWQRHWEAEQDRLEEQRLARRLAAGADVNDPRNTAFVTRLIQAATDAALPVLSSGAGAVVAPPSPSPPVSAMPTPLPNANGASSSSMSFKPGLIRSSTIVSNDGKRAAAGYGRLLSINDIAMNAGRRDIASIPSSPAPAGNVTNDIATTSVMLPPISINNSVSVSVGTAPLSPIPSDSPTESQLTSSSTSAATSPRDVGGINLKKAEELAAAEDEKMGAITRRRHTLMKPRGSNYNRDHWLMVHKKQLKRKVNMQEKVRYRHMFDLLDDDKSGALDFEELYDALTQTGLKATRQELQYIISQVDHNFRDTGQVTFEEFVNGFASISEWNLLATLRRDREAQGIKEPLLPFTHWVPSFHRQKQLEAVMSPKNVPHLLHASHADPTGVKALRQAANLVGVKPSEAAIALPPSATLVEGWSMVIKHGIVFNSSVFFLFVTTCLTVDVWYVTNSALCEGEA
jgi:hypothetical protein